MIRKEIFFNEYIQRKSISQNSKQYSSFHPKEKRIADYILKEADQIIYQSVKETAQQCGTSESSIVRFCKVIGYSGYSELKVEIAKAAFNHTSIQYQKELLQNGSSASFEERLRRFFSGTSHLLEKMYTQLDYSQLIRIADTICSCDLLLIYGFIYSGQSGFVFCERMKSLGIPSLIAWDHISMKQISVLAKKNTAALFISHSGASQDTVENAQLIKSRDACVIALTTAPASPLAKLSDMSVIIPAMDTSLFKYYYPVETAFTMVLSAIAMAAARHRQGGSSITDHFEIEVLKDALMPQN